MKLLLDLYFSVLEKTSFTTFFTSFHQNLLNYPTFIKMILTGYVKWFINFYQNSRREEIHVKLKIYMRKGSCDNSTNNELVEIEETEPMRQWRERYRNMMPEIIVDTRIDGVWSYSLFCQSNDSSASSGNLYSLLFLQEKFENPCLANWFRDICFLRAP